jgi:hypothetical protein
MSGLATVIIPVLNRYDLLERAIGSLGEVERLVIIDNGDGLGDDDLRMWQTEGQMEGNLVVREALNQRMKRIIYKYIHPYTTQMDMGVIIYNE